MNDFHATLHRLQEAIEDNYHKLEQQESLLASGKLGIKELTDQLRSKDLYLVRAQVSILEYEIESMEEKILNRGSDICSLEEELRKLEDTTADREREYDSLCDMAMKARLRQEIYLDMVKDTYNPIIETRLMLREEELSYDFALLEATYHPRRLHIQSLRNRLNELKEIYGEIP